MTDFSFDADKRFTDNASAFLKSVEDIDPEMASTLKQNWDSLLVVMQGERDTKARTTFNEAIASALDGVFPASKTAEEGE